MKPVIITIVGPSGSGKTFATEYLKKEIGIPVIVSFTTRPMRDGETNGVEHIFVDEIEMPPKNQMLAYTQFGGYHYWAELKQIPINGKCMYVIDEKGLIDLIEKFSNSFDIVSILIKRDVNKLSSISAERIKRDEYRIKIEDSFYHYIIENNGSLEEFKEKLTSSIKHI